jgi:NAD-dependent dihydropyrimidine dehydrogenase PreA subunit
MAGTLTVIVAENRTPTSQQEALVAAIVAGLSRRTELNVAVVGHLYDLAPIGPAVQQLRALAGDLVVLAWMYPRSAYWVLQAHGISGRPAPTTSSQESGSAAALSHAGAKAQDRTVWCLDLRNHAEPEPLLAEVLAIAGLADDAVPTPGLAQATTPSDEVARHVAEATHARWYPVIDRERCNHCAECLNFCLFGVFSLGESREITIAQPDACRNGCPACSRVCPEGAILFPQHHDPAIAGDPAASREGLRLDLSQLFAGGDDLMALANQERDAAVEEAKRRIEAAGRPSGVSAEVPSPRTSGPAPRSDHIAHDRDDLDRLVDGLDHAEL